MASSKELEDRAIFTQYVREIAAQQRNVLANRCQKIAANQKRMWPAFWQCQFLACGTSLTLLWAFGPRNVYSNSSYVARCLSPSIGIGLCLFGISWQGKHIFMKFRVWAMIEDFEYELKRVKAHHVPEGATHLAWLEFVLEQIKSDRTTQLDLDKLRAEPKNIC